MIKRGEYGRGSIRQKGQRWEIRYHVDAVGQDGERTRRRVSETFKTKKEARDRLNAVLGAIAEGRYQGPSSDKLDFSDLERMVLDHYDRKASCGRARRAAA